MIGNQRLPQGFRGTNYPAGKGDKDTRTNKKKYREAPYWDHNGPDKVTPKPLSNTDDVTVQKEDA